jgi:hypothetical protein
MALMACPLTLAYLLYTKGNPTACIVDFGDAIATLGNKLIKQSIY